MALPVCLSIVLALLSDVAVAKPLNGTRGSPHAPADPAQPCDASSCLLPDCNCASTAIPGGLQASDIPQIVMFSFDDALRDQDFTGFYDPIFSHRKNPNGCPIRLTYFVSHNFTDYALVENAHYKHGAEMADHSVTHRSPTTWWENAGKEELTPEIVDQQSILHLWGNVPKEDIRGFRVPFLATSEVEIEVVHENGFLYEASMVTDTNYWPFTLDYKSPICNSPATCPVNAYPGLWLVPNVVYKQSSGFPCPMLDACTAPVSEEDWLDFFDENFRVHYEDNRSPFGVYSHPTWFYTGQPQAKVDALNKFLDKLSEMKDVYIVTHSQMLDWVRDPTPLDKIEDFVPWKCPAGESPRCSVESPACSKDYGDGILKTCSAPCPPNYPTIGNPEGK